MHEECIAKEECVRGSERARGCGAAEMHCLCMRPRARLCVRAKSTRILSIV
jgi:hypothetical protein